MHTRHILYNYYVVCIYYTITNLSYIVAANRFIFEIYLLNKNPRHKRINLFLKYVYFLLFDF